MAHTLKLSLIDEPCKLKIEANLTVSCGTLALWAVAVGLLVVMMQFYSKSRLL
jgi:hypothetical protein